MLFFDSQKIEESKYVQFIIGYHIQIYYSKFAEKNHSKTARNRYEQEHCQNKVYFCI